MSEMTMNWMITQIFLSDTGVHEVYVHNSTHKLRCDCPGFKTRNNCKHTRFVQTRMDTNGGIYPVEISKRVKEDEALSASDDPKAFRELLLTYGKIETRIFSLCVGAIFQMTSLCGCSYL
jgi:hypothetical protein